MRLALIGFAVAALMETLQQIVPGRHAYFSDFVINAAGAWAGLAAAMLLDWFRRRIAATGNLHGSRVIADGKSAG